MPVVHTNERPGTRAVLRHFHMSASKARVVLDLVRGKDVITAQEILGGTPREAASVIAKVLASAIANAVNNDGQVQDELYVATAYADEGTTMKRFKPRARGRGSRIRKRACHVTIVVAQMDDERLTRARAARGTESVARSRRVAGSRRRADQQSHAHRREVAREELAEQLAADEQVAAEEAANAALEADDTEVDTADADSVGTDAHETDAHETDAHETESDGVVPADEGSAATNDDGDDTAVAEASHEEAED
jgi:large subunit ribosomal protein L22